MKYSFFLIKILLYYKSFINVLKFLEGKNKSYDFFFF
jgi:hypothetical protein